jgi:hypothetical protein
MKWFIYSLTDPRDGKPQKNRGKAIDKGAKRGIIRVTDNMALHATESVKR